MGRGQRRRWELQELDPEWVDKHPPRYNYAFRIDCPTHGTHRLTIRLCNPYDGFEEVEELPGVSALMVQNGSFDELTLTSPAGSDALDFGRCGQFRIIEGRVELVR